MNKFFRFSIAAAMLCSAALMALATPAMAQTVFVDEQWVAPDGIPQGAFANEFNLYSSFAFFLAGKQYAPPKDWMIFAGDGYFLEGQIPPPMKICFNFSKSLNNGVWHGQIFLLENGVWVGMPTTVEYLAQYPGMPFLCTMAPKTGLYIVGNYWTPE